MTKQKDGLNDTISENRLIDRHELSRLTGFTVKTIRVYDNTKRYDFKPIRTERGKNVRVRYRLSHILKLIADWELGSE